MAKKKRARKRAVRAAKRRGRFRIQAERLAAFIDQQTDIARAAVEEGQRRMEEERPAPQKTRDSLRRATAALRILERVQTLALTPGRDRTRDRRRRRGRAPGVPAYECPFKVLGEDIEY
jgi:hypothetical protein